MPEFDFSSALGVQVTFDAYFTGAWGQSAYVEYSLDGGSSWTSFFTIPSSMSWTTYSVELTGVDGEASVLIAFHSDDNGGWGSGVGIDNVSVDYGRMPTAYYVYLDGGQVGETPGDVTTYQYQGLVYGQEYTAAVRAVYACGTSDPIEYTFTSGYLYPPRNLTDEYVYNTNEVPLFWNPPVTVEATMASEVNVVDFSVMQQVSLPLGEDSYMEGTVTGSSRDLTCPDESVYGNPGTDFSTASTSEADPGYSVAQHVTGVAGPFNTITFYGLSAVFSGGWSPCNGEDPMPFIVNVYEDGSQPTDLIGSYTADIDLEETGETFAGTYPIYKFTVQIDQQTLTDGWIEIQGQTSGSDCWFLWLDSPNGSDEALQWDGSAWGMMDDPVAICLTQEGNVGGGTVPDGLVGFNVYKDGVNIDEVPYNGEGPDDFIPYTDLDVMPGCYDYMVTAVYDLTVFGFPGEFGESMPEGPDEVCVAWGAELPFCEDWSQGTFDFHNWTPDDGGNWEVNSNNGNGAPSAQWNWDPDPGADYTSSLTSQPFNADMITEGNIWLDFDIALTDRNATGDEMMTVEVYNGSDWSEVATFDNADGSFDYMNNHIDISSMAMHRVFMVRFTASGANSFDVINWNVDNICIYRTCAAPTDLTGEYLWTSGEEWGAMINWQAEPPQASGTWISYVEGPYVAGIGLTGDAPITVAIQWDPEDLGAYDGMEFSKLRYYFGQAIPGTAVVQVWEDDNLILEEDAGAITANDWNEVTFSTPVTIDASKTYKLGYTASGYGWDPDGPCGAQDYMGDPNSDLVYLNGVWDHLNNYLPYSWLIETFVSDPVSATPNHFEPIESSVAMSQHGDVLKGVKASAASQAHSMAVHPSDRTLNHFNVFRSPEGEENYTLLGTVDAEAGVTEYSYYDTDVDIATYCYKVTAVYQSETDECESDFALTPEEDADYVCVYVTGINNPLAAETVVYPNPARDQVTISSSEEMTRITIVNYVGQLIENRELNQNKVVLNTTNYESGIYLVRIETESGIVTKRFAIAR
jgi:hypothetical protein